MLRSNNYRILLSITISLILISQLVAVQVSNFGIANEDTQRNYELTSAQKSALANLRGGSDNLSLDLNWLSTGGGTGGTDFVNDIATDSSGNVIIVGTASYNVTLANLQISASEGQTAFVAKLNQFGYWTWAISIQGGSSYIVALDIDSNNMIYVLGVAYEQVTAGAYTIGTANSNDIFVAKINPQGGWVWAKSASTGYNADPAEIAVDGSGNVGIVGTFWNTITFGSTAFSSSGNSDIFVAKLNSGGNMWLWAESFGGENSDYGNAIDTWEIGSGSEGNCSSSQDNFFITGAFSSYIEFGGVNYTTNRYNSSAFVTWLCGSNGDVFSAIVEGESSGTNILRSWSTFSSWSLGTGWYSSSTTSNYDSCTGAANGYSYYYLYTYDCDYPNSLTYTSSQDKSLVNSNHSEMPMASDNKFK